MRSYAVVNLSNMFIALDELSALHKVERLDYEYSSGVAFFEGDPKVADKASYIEYSGILLGKSNNINELIDLVRGNCYTIKLNAILGMDKELLLNAYNVIKEKVKLSKKCETLDMISSDGEIILGLRKGEHDTKSLIEHSKKPYRQSGTMDSRTSRLLVNLSRPKRIVLDPFTGTGSILIEARWLGYECVGGDLDERMLHKAKINLRHFGYNCELLKSSAFNIPIRKINSIATDPPYGRSSTTFGVELRKLYEDFFNRSAEIIESGGHLVFATASEFDFRDMLKSVGFKNIKLHFIYLHKSLSRAIYVVRKD